MIDLFKAAYANDVAKVSLAIAEGQDANAQSQRAGTIPLQLACQGNALDAIKVLLAAGADPNRRFTRTSRVDGRVFAAHVPLMYVTIAEAADLLLNAGADINAMDADGNSPLMSAIQKGNQDLVEFLLDRGALIGFEANQGSVLRLVDEQLEQLRALAGSHPSPDALRSLGATEGIRNLLLTRCRDSARK